MNIILLRENNHESYNCIGELSTFLLELDLHKLFSDIPSMSQVKPSLSSLLSLSSLFLILSSSLIRLSLRSCSIQSLWCLYASDSYKQKFKGFQMIKTNVIINLFLSFSESTCQMKAMINTDKLIHSCISLYFYLWFY